MLPYICYQLGSKIQKELVDLCSLRKFQLFAISNKENSSNQIKTAKLLGGKTLLSSYILCKFWNFSKANFSESIWYIGVSFS